MELRGLDRTQVWDYENAFHWFSSPTRTDKALAQYELYKRIIGLPGHVIEFGVFKAASLIRFGTYRRLLETETSRKIVGFDAFGSFPHAEAESAGDRDFISRFEDEAGDGLDREETEAVLRHKGFGNIELIEGDIADTLPEWLSLHREAQIALLHVDVDVYEPAKLILEQCYDRVVSGGLIVLDDYNAVEGETVAVNEFIAPRNLRVEKLPYYSVPSFIVKP